jgi:ABC-type transport system involved in multi-copper enzyme maturation permease subunit
MMQVIKKEIQYGLRSYRFIILLVGFLFFAMLNPVMSKFIMPEVMKSQMPGLTEEVMAQMMATTQLGVMRTYMGDVFEIVSLLVAFSLCGLIAQEVKDNTLVLPLCSGKRFGAIVFAKIAVFGTTLIVIPVIAALLGFAYSGVLYTFDLTIGPVIRAGLLQGVFMVFVVALLVMWGAIIKKPIAAGFVTLATVFGLHFVGNALGISTYLPSGLLEEAALFAVIPASSLWQTLGITVGIILMLSAAALWRLKSMEWNER